MARSDPDPRPRLPRRVLRMLRDFLLIFGVAFLLPYVGYRVLHHPRGTEPAVAMPPGVVVGTAPGSFVSGDYRLTVSGVRWVRQSSLPPGLKLSFRARPSAVVDYLVVSLTIADSADTGLPLTFEGSGQDVRLLLASTDPARYHVDPIGVDEAAAIAGEPGLADGPLLPGEQRSGVVVYAIEPYRKALELLLVPVYGVGVTPEQGPQHPAFEIHLPQPR